MATRGRKPKPTAMKELEGNPGKHPLNTSEPKPNKMEGGRGVHHPARHYRQDPVRVLAAGAAGFHRPDLSEDHE